ncbi:MAG: glucokinase [Pseudobdellovibrionaceae bacterium]|jgi:glucokinase|nr:glucokinase [Pseudobdellovibrionaceae bacterium]
MTVLIADIGGTNARFGIVDQQGTHDLKYLECKNFAGPVEAAEHYLKEISSKERPKSAVFAVAGPVGGDLINFTGSPWTFRVSAAKQEMGLDVFEVMNDFKANALAIPGISSALLHKVGGGEPVEKAPIGVIGPGTGLGVAYLTWAGDRYEAFPTEGGHVTFPATTEREVDIFHRMKAKYHHISAERVCSGKGLENLYNAIKVLDHKFDLPELEAPEISKKAIEGSCVVCKEALDLMLGFLGRAAGNLALTLGAQGGIYVAGGIPTKLGEYFYKSRYWDEFTHKGRMSDYNKAIPSYLIQHDAIGLLGLEQTARRYL